MPLNIRFGLLLRHHTDTQSNTKGFGWVFFYVRFGACFLFAVGWQAYGSVALQVFRLACVAQLWYNLCTINGKFV